MRKFYSIVLTACALLFSANVSAVDVNSRKGIQDAIDGTPAGGTVNIRLTANITMARDEMPIRVYGNYADAKKTVNLDLGGHTISVGDSRAIELLKGNLNISNGTITKTKSVPYHTAAFYDTYDKNNKPIYYSGGLIGGKCLYNCTEKSDSKGAYYPDEAILVCGSYDPNAENWAVLTIGKDVLVQTICPNDNADGGSGIAVLELNSYGNSLYSTESGFICTPNVTLNNGEGGVTFTPHDYWKNENGDMVVDYTTYFYREYSTTAEASGAYKDKYKYKTGLSYTAGNFAKFGFGVKIDVYGKVYGHEYGIKITGNFKWIGGNAPYVHIWPSAEVWSAPNPGSTGAYSSGIGTWLIEGHIYGATGVYVKSGNVTIKDAQIESSCVIYTENEAAGVGHGGVKGGGSAIVIESSETYAGVHDVKIEGDTKIKGAGGYAIEETITDASGTKVKTVTVEGGTIEAGEAGTAIFTKNTTEGAEVSIVGGNIEDKVTIKEADGTTSTVEVSTFFPNTGEYTTTEVEGEDGKKIVVITKLEDGVTIDKDGMTVAAAAAAGKGLKWTGTAEELAKTDENPRTVVLPYLEINDNKAQTLTVKEGVTLEVGRIVMGSQAQIIVEAGAGLIVTGEQGMVANATDNVVLEANASKQATFVISPKVTSNKQPMASVKYYTNAYGIPKTGTSTNYKWDRLTSPLSEYVKISHNYSEVNPELLAGESAFWTFIEYYDEVNGKWVGLTAYNQMKAFTSYALSNNTKEGKITYTFEGRVQGNVADNIELDHAGWNYMGNAFVAPIHVRSMLSAIEKSGAGIDASMYLWDMDNQKYNPVNKTRYTYFSDGPKEIPALQTFIVKLTSGNSAKLDLNYATSVYGYVTNPNTYSAPRRAVASDVNTLRINIKAANGAEDDVYFVESAEFTEDYDNGADITKYMNKGMNFYANGEYAMVASDNIEGATLSLQTIDEVDYTLTFAEVNGEEYALRDNLTGRVVLMTEGASYRFTAQPNQTVESRFQIVPRQQMPTEDINTVNETAGSKAVYTVLGQYVGETENWNQLPAGIYVVDGIKIVK